MSTWRYVASLSWTFKWLLALDFLAAVAVIVGFEQAYALILREVFDTLTGNARTSLSVWALCAMFVGIATARLVIQVGMSALQSANQFMVGTLLQRNALAHLMSLRGDRDLPASPGEAVTRFRDDSSSVGGFLGEAKFLATHVVFVVVAFFIMFQVSPFMTLVGFVPLLAVLVVVNAAKLRIQRTRRRSREAAGDVTGFIGEMFGSVEAIKVAGAESSVLDEFDRVNTARKRATLRDTLLTQSLNAVFQNIQHIGTGAILIVAGHAMLSGEFTVGDLALFTFYLWVFSALVMDVGQLIVSYRQVGVGIGRLCDLLPGSPPETLVEGNPTHLFRAPTDPIPAVKTEADRLESLEARDVTYVYPESGQGVHDISLSLRQGSFTVVTGRVGSGKSTLLRVLLGSLPLQAGELRWNGRPVQDVSGLMVPPRVAYTSQVPRLFSEELRANILLGLRENRVDLAGAVHAAVLERDIDDLEHGLATIVGPRGVRLSGGQHRRAAAARMFIRDPELLVFDDLSSGLDVATEKTLWERLSSHPGRTVLAVSHRRTAFRRADHIVVLKDGHLAACPRNTVGECLGL